MTAILRIDCSPRGPAAHSARMADELLAALEAKQPGAKVLRRHLAESPPPLIDAAFAAAMRDHQTAELARGVPALQQSEALIGELENTDLLVISTPMHNFTIPAALKAWIDQVVRFGRTFRGTPEGKIGLLKDRPAFVIVSSGGYFTPPRANQPDFLTAYLASILTTIGIRDITIFPMQGLTRGDAALSEAYATVRAQIAADLVRRFPV